MKLTFRKHHIDFSPYSAHVKTQNEITEHHVNDLPRGTLGP